MRNMNIKSRLIKLFHLRKTESNKFINGRWYWITDGSSTWIAKRDTLYSAGGWTNDDTWENFDNKKITGAEIIPFATWEK